MKEEDITTLLLQNKILNKIEITKTKGIFKLVIHGELWIQQIKDIFNVIDWEYSKGVAIFYIKGS